MRFLIPSATLALCLAASAPAAAEDLTIVSKVSGPGGASASTQYFSASKFRSSSGEADSIFDVASGRLTVLDNQKKQYWETTLEELNAVMGAVNAQMQQMQEQMKGNPMAAQMLEKMMGGAPAAVEVQKGANPKKVAGYDCEHWVVKMGTQLKMEIWATPAIVPPTQFWDARRALAAANPMMQRWGALFDELKKIKGFTLAETTTVSMLGRNVETTTEASEVKKGEIPDAAFAVPAGYKKVESPLKDAAGKMKGRPRG